MLKDNRVLVVALLSFLMITLPMTSFVQNNGSEDEFQEEIEDIDTNDWKHFDGITPETDDKKTASTPKKDDNV